MVLIWIHIKFKWCAYKQQCITISTKISTASKGSTFDVLLIPFWKLNLRVVSEQLLESALSFYEIPIICFRSHFILKPKAFYIIMTQLLHRHFYMLQHTVAYVLCIKQLKDCKQIFLSQNTSQLHLQWSPQRNFQFLC